MLYVFFMEFEWKHLLSHSVSGTVYISIVICIFFLRDVKFVIFLRK